MNYISDIMGAGTAVAMTWGEYRASLPKQERDALRPDPFNRTPAEAAIEQMRTGLKADDATGFFVNPDGASPYLDPTPRWLDSSTFNRTCRPTIALI